MPSARSDLHDINIVTKKFSGQKSDSNNTYMKFIDLKTKINRQHNNCLNYLWKSERHLNHERTQQVTAPLSNVRIFIIHKPCASIVEAYRQMYFFSCRRSVSCQHRFRWRYSIHEHIPHEQMLQWLNVTACMCVDVSINCEQLTLNRSMVPSLVEQMRSVRWSVTTAMS